MPVLQDQPLGKDSGCPPKRLQLPRSSWFRSGSFTGNQELAHLDVQRRRGHVPWRASALDDARDRAHPLGHGYQDAARALSSRDIRRGRPASDEDVPGLDLDTIEDAIASRIWRHSGRSAPRGITVTAPSLDWSIPADPVLRLVDPCAARGGPFDFHQPGSEVPAWSCGTSQRADPHADLTAGAPQSIRRQIPHRSGLPISGRTVRSVVSERHQCGAALACCAAITCARPTRSAPPLRCRKQGGRSGLIVPPSSAAWRGAAWLPVGDGPAKRGGL